MTKSPGFTRVLYAVVILFFVIVNALPYWMRHEVTKGLRLKVVMVMEENGRPVDIFTRARSVSRRFARSVADFVGLEREKPAEGEVFLVEVEVHNSSRFNMDLAKANYTLYIDDRVIARGHYERSNPLRVPARDKANLILPFELLNETSQFADLIRVHSKGIAKGTVGLVRKDRLFTVDIDSEIDFSELK